MNLVTLIGNLTTDVEAEGVGSEAKATFTLAVDRPTSAGGTDLISVETFGRQAELASQYLSKGRRIAIDGRIQSTDGHFAVVARRIEYLGAPGEAS
jgi:single-strand DNA-binding protein